MAASTNRRQHLSEKLVKTIPLGNQKKCQRQDWKPPFSKPDNTKIACKHQKDQETMHNACWITNLWNFKIQSFHVVYTSQQQTNTSLRDKQKKIVAEKICSEKTKSRGALYGAIKRSRFEIEYLSGVQPSAHNHKRDLISWIIEDT